MSIKTYNPTDVLDVKLTKAEIMVIVGGLDWVLADLKNERLKFYAMQDSDSASLVEHKLSNIQALVNELMEKI